MTIHRNPNDDPEGRIKQLTVKVDQLMWQELQDAKAFLRSPSSADTIRTLIEWGLEVLDRDYNARGGH